MTATLLLYHNVNIVSITLFFCYYHLMGDNDYYTCYVGFCQHDLSCLKSDDINITTIVSFSQYIYIH